MITIRECMNNKTILITGGAGFFGKVLTEKLLRACPGVKRIYLIIRPKGGQDPKERWANIVKDVLFEKLLADAPDIIYQKVTVLDGDMSLIDLGLSHETIKELKNTVNIIFHSAATVRFNDQLQKAFLSNTRGTLELCKLASKMNNLEVFVHVSTTYCNHNLKKGYYEEKIYEPCQDWRTILKLIEEENPAVMNNISYKITQDHPNTYTFSKSLSEKIVEEYSSKFPAVIVRPSVVVGTYREPIPGWMDNLNGIIGVKVAVCKGVMRVIKAEKNCVLDYVPVDIAINALIICGWDKATRLMKVTIKIHLAIQALAKFTRNNIKFDNKKYKALWEKLIDDEAEIFLVKPPPDFNSKELMSIMHFGVKKYFLKENLEDEGYHKLKLRRFYYLDQLVRGILISSLFISIYNMINVAMDGWCGYAL